MTQLHRLSAESLAAGLLRMNARVFFAAVLGMCLFVGVHYFAPDHMILSRRFNYSILILFEVTCVSALLRLYGPALMRSRWGVLGWRSIFIVHSTAYALTWGLTCMHMIEILRMNAYSISVTTTALAACTVAVSAFSFDLLACALFLGASLVPLLKASLFSVEHGEGLAGACTLSITFFLHLAYSIHRAEVDSLINQDVIRDQADRLKGSNELFRDTIDSIDEVLLVIGLDGTCYGNRSDRAARLLGAEPLGRHVSSILRLSGAADHDLREWLELLGTGRFEFERIVGLAPSRWVDEVNQLTYRVAWFPMRSGDVLKSVIMTLTDVTEALRAESLASQAEERARLVLAISADRLTFAEFLTRAETHLKRWRDWDGRELEQLRKDLHDLKGFAGVFGFASFIAEVSAAEHRIKSAAEVEVTAVVREACVHLDAWLKTFLAREDATLRRLRVFGPRELRLSLAHLEATRDLFATDPSRAELLDRFVTRLSAPNLGRMLGRFEELVANTARRLGKQVELEITKSCDTVYLDQAAWIPVVDAMVHLMNNAVDHGLETPAERRARGKPAAGRIQVTAEASGGSDQTSLVIHVDDDGRGLDLDGLRQKLRERGIQTAGLSEEALAAYVFAPSVSTKDVATDVSGQGVGLYSVADAVARAGGRVFVTRGDLGGARFTIALGAANTRGARAA